jgi:hypothetical protein
VALVGPRLGVEDDHAVVAIPVGDDELAGGGIHHHVGRPVEALGVLVVADHARLADLQEQLPGPGELEDHPVLRTVAGQPNVVLIVDVDAVLVLRPRLPGGRATPRLHERAGLVELEYGRCRPAAERAGRRQRGALLVVGERLGALHDPDVIALVDRHAGRLAHQPAVWQGLGPERIDLEHWGAAHRGRNPIVHRR